MPGGLRRLDLHLAFGDLGFKCSYLQFVFAPPVDRTSSGADVPASTILGEAHSHCDQSGSMGGTPTVDAKRMSQS